MTEYTTPVTTAFQMKRQSIEQSQKVFEQGVAFQKNVTDAVVDSLDSQESAQRRGVELAQTAFHSYLDTVEATVPGVAPTVGEVRAAVDEQYEFLLENHAETFENVEAELVEQTDAYDELTEDVLTAMNEQVALLVDAHEDLESQSVEAAEQWGAQIEELQDQVEEVQDQVREVQEQAADAVEA
jgi:methyl-accepting chemotaxis protein